MIELNWRDKLKIKWEYFLLDLGLRTPEKFQEDILRYFLKRGWHFGGVHHTTTDGIKKIIAEEYENLKKCRQNP